MVYLPRLRERADHSRRRLLEAGFAHIVLSAGVDGATDDPRALGARRGLYFDPALAEGEIGCALAMIGLWETVVERGWPYMLIFEDDVLPHPDIGRIGHRYWAETPRATDFVFLGNQFARHGLPEPQRRVISSPSWCLHAYLISQEGARRALALLGEQINSDDRWLSSIDNEIRHWMQLGAIRYSCWNGTMLPVPFPSSGDDEDPHMDAIRADRSTGLFFQNLSLGSTIWPGSARQQRNGVHPSPRSVLIAPVGPFRHGSRIARRAGVVLDGLAAMSEVTLAVAPVHGTEPGHEWAAERARRTLVLPSEVADPFLRHIGRIASPQEQLRARLTYPRPLSTAWATPQAASAILELTGNEVELIYVLGGCLGPLVEHLRARVPGAGLIFDVGDYEPSALRRQAELLRLAGEPDEAEVADAGKFERAMTGWVRAADLVLAAGASDLASFRSLASDVPARELANPIRPYGPGPSTPAVDLLFVANFGHAVNLAAAVWLCDEVLPLIRQRLHREVRLSLAGRHVGPQLSAYADTEVNIIVDPASVTPLYESTSVVVAPTGVEATAQILAALSHRRAVVSTSAGASGLPVVAGRHLLLADSSAQFGDACASVLSDCNLRRHLVSAGVEIALAYAWPKVAGRFAEVAAEIAQRRGFGDRPDGGKLPLPTADGGAYGRADS